MSTTLIGAPTELPWNSIPEPPAIPPGQVECQLKVPTSTMCLIMADWLRSRGIKGFCATSIQFEFYTTDQFRLSFSLPKDAAEDADRIGTLN